MIIDGKHLSYIFELALTEIGAKEAGDNPEVLRFYAEAGHPEVKHTSVAWCAAYVGAILHRAGDANSGSLMARSYLSYGIRIPQPMHGCIVVFERGPIEGHVAFFDRYVDGMLRCLGGNQDDMVCFENFPVGRVLGYRIPVARASGLE